MTTFPQNALGLAQGARCPLDGNGRRGRVGQDDVGLQADQLVRERSYPTDVTAAPPKVHARVAAHAGPRSWYVDVDEITLDDEIAFLNTELYLRDFEPRLQTLTAFTRFSIRA